MNWAAAMYTLGIWTLVVSIWLLHRPGRQPDSNVWFSAGVVRDLLPGLLLAVLVARLL